MRFNSIEKDHLRFPKKVIFKDGIDWSFIFVQNSHELWKSLAGSWRNSRLLWTKKKRGYDFNPHRTAEESERTIESWEGPARSLSCFLRSPSGVLAQGNPWLWHMSELMFGFAPRQDWVSRTHQRSPVMAAKQGAGSFITHFGESPLTGTTLR